MRLSVASVSLKLWHFLVLLWVLCLRSTSVLGCPTKPWVPPITLCTPVLSCTGRLYLVFYVVGCANLSCPWIVFLGYFFFFFFKLSAFPRVQAAWRQESCLGPFLVLKLRNSARHISTTEGGIRALVLWGTLVLAAWTQRYWHCLTISLDLLGPLVTLPSNQTYPFGLQVRPGLIFQCRVYDLINPLMTPFTKAS